MKILVLSTSGYGAWFSAIFERAGHQVSYHVTDKRYKDVLRNICPTPLRFPVIPGTYESSKYDLVVFDMSGRGREVQEFLTDGLLVIGDSLLADKLEDDRVYGLQAMESSGIDVPPWQSFNNISSAKKFIQQTGKRYVFKPSNAPGQIEDSTAATYVSKSAQDLLDYLEHLSNISSGGRFVLQEFVQGTEISTEGYFNGSDWYFINNTLEEKKFMNGNLGPNTGCSGNVVWGYPLYNPKIFANGLAKMTKFLQEHNYVGMIDLNSIISDVNGKLYGLEFTPRFGYDATPTQIPLLEEPADYAQFLYNIVQRRKNFHTRISGQFSASVRLSINPYPLETENLSEYVKGVPINDLSDNHVIDDLRSWYLYDIMQSKKGQLVTCGASGFIGCPIAQGSSIRQAFNTVYDMIKQVEIPDVQYRTDIGDCCEKRYEKLRAAGWFRAAGISENTNNDSVRATTQFVSVEYNS